MMYFLIYCEKYNVMQHVETLCIFIIFLEWALTDNEKKMSYQFAIRLLTPAVTDKKK